MSGGNPFQRSLSAALLLLLGLGLGTSARASGAEAPPLSIGIATANIAWEEPAKVVATFNAIQTAGFGIVRIGLKEPLPRSYAALVSAKEAGLKIVLTIPLIDGAVAEAGAKPRPRQERFFPAYGLSQIDLSRFDARLAALLDFAVDQQIPLIGLELGNELNWSGYNGDLPFAKGGHVIGADKDWPKDVKDRFADGLARYHAVFKRAEAALGRRPALSDVKLVSAGLADINAGFIRQSGTTYVAPALVYRAFSQRGIFNITDAVGIHLYEPLRSANRSADRLAMIDAQLDDCGGATFARRPCWITEFGSALPQAECGDDDSERITLLRPLLDRLHKTAAAVPLALYYDWSEDKGFALQRCGRPTALTKLLSDQNAAP
jgi:hypothetical protein